MRKSSRSKYTQRVSKLADYNEDGLHAALLKGTNVPLFGTITGKKQSDGSYVHEFSYMGVPKEFKIAILEADGTIIVTDAIKRTQFQSVMELTVEKINGSAETKTAVKEVLPQKENILIGALLRLVATLVIEIFVAFLFGFTIKKYWKALVIVNLITQIALNIIIGAASKNSEILAYIAAELFAVIAEMIAFGRLLTDKKLLRRLIYTVVANIVSFAAGFLPFFIF